jgi:hypothetical protein
MKMTAELGLTAACCIHVALYSIVANLCGISPSQHSHAAQHPEARPWMLRLQWRTTTQPTPDFSLGHAFLVFLGIHSCSCCCWPKWNRADRSMMFLVNPYNAGMARQIVVACHSTISRSPPHMLTAPCPSLQIGIAHVAGTTAG